MTFARVEGDWLLQRFVGAEEDSADLLPAPAVEDSAHSYEFGLADAKPPGEVEDSPARFPGMAAAEIAVPCAVQEVADTVAHLYQELLDNKPALEGRLR